MALGKLGQRSIATAIWGCWVIFPKVYVSNFADYNKTYGAMGAVIGPSLWFNPSSYAAPCWGPNSTCGRNTMGRGTRRRGWSVRSASGAPMSLIRWGTSG